MRNRDDRSTSGRSRDGRSEKGYRSKNDARINKSSQRSSTEGRPPTTGRRDKAGRTNKSNHSSGGASVASARSRASRATSVRHDTRTGRMVFEAKGRKIYEFEQTDKDITIYIGAPSFVKSTSELSCNITKTHLQLGLAGSSKWFIDENTFGPVDISKSSWNLGQESGSNVIFVYLRKYNRGDHWETALHGKSKGTVRPAKKRDS
uniref:CS domain-containing protein n=1 Tax=Craspedostauros australis TaxID=1486917 RepID=A0A7R9ZKZ9_9STRA